MIRHMHRLPCFAAVCLLPLAGCPAEQPPDDDDDTPVEWDYELDPDVDGYVPDGYVPVDPARVIYLGDSITAGAGASSGSTSYTSLLVENDEDEWGGWGEQDLRSLYGDGFEVVDVSRGGATTSSLVQDQLPALSSELGDSVSGSSIVVMTVGGNDMQSALFPILLSNDPDAVATERIGEVEANMETTLDYFEDSTRFPDGVHLFFTNIYEPSDAVGVSQCFFETDYSTILRHFDQANATMRALAEERGTAMVDLRGHFLGHGMYSDDESVEAYDAQDPTQWFSDDCIHPNDRGHHELRRLFITAIEGRPMEAFGEAP